MPEGCRVTIVNDKGLHARASARFVELSEQFSAAITVSKDDWRVDGRSIMGLLLLAAAKGSEIDISAEGEDATAAIAALSDLVNRGFDET